MHHSLIQRIALLSVYGFFLAAFAAAFHCHDNSLSQAFCSICKVKTSVYETVGKSKIPSTPAVPVVSIGVEAGFAFTTNLVHEDPTIFIPSQVAYIYPNKAPPVRS